MAEAGWYPDPQEPGFLQFFDGREWTGDRRPAPSETPPSGAPATQQVGSPNWQAPPATVPQPVPPAQPTVQQPAAVQQPGWQQPPAQPAWAPAGTDQQTVQQPAARPEWQQSPAQQPWQQPAPPPGASPAAPRRGRGRLVLALVAVVLVAAGALTWLLWPSSDSPALTFRGKPIADPSAVLTSAEQDVAALVGTRHGAKSGETRCYFAQPKTPAPGAAASDVGQVLWCGPVLFVDGDPSQNYLPLPLMSSSESGSSVTLHTAPGINSIQPQALDGTLSLVRPDGLTPPKGNGGIAVPKPPAADQDVLTAAPLGPTPAPQHLSNARIVGKTGSVVLEAAGVIPRYGEGDSARSAPPGEQLLAFQVKYGAGDVRHSRVTANIVVDGGTPRPLPVATASDDWLIAAVPQGSNAVIQYVDAGYTQTLSLPAGTPGADNITVLTRQHRTSLVDQSVSVPVHLSDANGSADVTWLAQATTAELNFWIPGHVFRHPTNADDAVLSVHLNYHYSDSPGQTYGFDPQLLRLRLPDGSTVKAENVAGKNKINDVFVVPADFTDGTVVVTGHEVVNGVNVAITRAVSIPVSIPAG